jgi:glycosyltransferase involved in cell wall biosynthesis
VLLQILVSSSSHLPAISVVIPSYNCAKTIVKAVESALNQTYQGTIEVIVVNDGSPDTVAQESALGPYFDRIQYIKQRNRGVSMARNAGVLAASAPWVAFLDGDDYWYPNCLEVLQATADDKWDMVYGNADMLGPACFPNEKYRDWSPSSGEVTAASLIAGTCCVLTSNVLVKRQAVIDAGMFDPSMHHSEDLELWLRLAMDQRRITYTNESLMAKVTVEGSQSEDRTKMVVGVMRICRRLLIRKDSSDDVKAAAQRRLSDSKRYYLRYKIKQSSALSLLTKNPVWCYFRHAKINGYCANCDRTWRKDN